MDNSTNTCMLIGEEERQELLLAMSLGGVLASLVCLFALILVLRFKLYKYFSHRLASYQVLSSLFFSVICSVEMVFVNYYSNERTYRPACEGIGFLFEYAVWLKLLFMMWLTLHLFCFTMCYKSSENKEVLIVISLMLIPFLFIWVPFLHEAYGLSGAWCWIKNWNNSCIGEKLFVGEIEQYALLYIPAFSLLFGATVLLSTMMLVMACRSSKQHTPTAHNQLLLVSDRQRRKVLKELLPLAAYPILTFIFIIPPFINRIYGDVSSAVNLTAFMSSAIATSFPSLFSGLTLLIHVMVLKCPKPKFPRIKRNANEEMTDTSCSDEHHMTEYTTYTLGSTNCRTHFSVPFESEVDNAFLGGDL